MKILLTGANGYIGTRLLALLAEAGNCVYAVVRSRERIEVPAHLRKQVEILEADLLDPHSLKQLPKEVDAAYYLVHSMTSQRGSFDELERCCAENFSKAIQETKARQIIYLSGLCNDPDLSPHLASRLQVERILRDSGIPLTTLRAGIIIGSGSASFEIIRDLVEKLPIMIAPKWVNNLCQPISIYDILHYLKDVCLKPDCLGRTFDVGGPETLTYEQMMQILAQERGLRRYILRVPVLTPRLSSYWLVFITSTNFSLAYNLVDSLKNEAVCKDSSIRKIIPRDCLTYREAVQRAFVKIEQNAVISSWRDAMTGSALNPHLADYIEVPEHGCVQETVTREFTLPASEVKKRIWSLGGDRGWLSYNWAWRLRGWLDKWVGGVGLRRGRTHPEKLKEGDALDFWRVLHVNKKSGHLLLYAEMLVPGEAWLEFTVSDTTLTQTATFRPKGVFGRLYWYALLPLHKLVFNGLASALTKKLPK